MASLWTGRAGLAASTCALAMIAAGQAAAQESHALDPVVVQRGSISEATGGVAVTAEDLELIEPRDTRGVFQRESAVTVGGGAAASQEIFVHGFGQSNLAVTIDGARQPGNIWHHNGTTLIDPTFLRSVSVDPGVAPADAGFGAAAGAIEFETVNATDMLEPGDTFGGRATLGYATNGDTWNGSLGLYGMQDGFDYLAIFSRNVGDDYENGDGDTQQGTEDNLTSGLVKFGYQTEGGDRFEVSWEGSEDDADRLLRINMDAVGGEHIFNENKVIRNTATLRYTRTEPNGWWDPDILFYYTEMDLRRPNDNDFLRPSGDFNSDTTIWGGKAENSFALDIGAVTAGVDFYDYKVDIERFHFPDDADESVKGLGVYAQARLDLTDRLALSAGLRVDGQRYEAVDGQDFEKSGVSPNATLIYEVVDGFSVFAGASRPWLGIPQSEAALFHARDYSYDDDLKAATSENYKIGANFAYGNWSGSASWFKTELKNGEAYEYAPDFSTATRINGGDLTSEGYDAAVNYGWATGQAGLRVTYADVTYGDTVVFPGATTAAPMGTTAVLFLDQRIERFDLTVGGNIQWASKVDDDDLIEAGFEPIEDYTVVDLYALWQPRRVADLGVRFGIDNLFDENYIARGTYPDSVRVNAVEAAGRTFTLSAVLNF